MTDRDLLEAAAKAAGMNYAHELGGCYSDPEFNEVVEWNPLTDDGDALRLAVAKQMMIQHTTSYVTVFVHTVCAEEISESVKHRDRNAATRRAIVRAAAALAA